MKFMIIDDRPDDRKLIRRRLQRDFGQAEFIEISRRKDFERAIDQGEFDLVLTDYRLQWSNGLEILRAIRNRWPQAPVIMVTNSGGEEIAVEGMKAGLSNYVLKDHLQRLPLVVQESLAALTFSREQELAEARRISSERKFRAVFEHASDAIFLMDESACIDCNPAAEKLFGCGRELILLARTEDFSPPTQPDGQPSRDKALNKTRAALAGSPQLFEWQYRQADGTPVVTEVSLSRIEIEGRFMVLAVVRDLSERRRLAADLVESKKKLRQVAETVREVFWIRDARTRRIIYISPAYEALWGRSCQSLYDQPESFIDAIHPEDRERVVVAFQDQPEQGEIFDQEYRVIRPDGTIRWVWARTFPVRNEQGQVYRLVGVAEDITRRKQAEAQLVRRNRELALLNRVIAASAGALEIEVILNTVCRELVLAFDVSVALAALLDQTQTQIRIVAEYRAGSQEPSELNQTFPVAEARVWQQLLASQQPLAVADIPSDPYLSRFDRLIDRHNAGAILVLPVIVEDEMIGSLALVDNKPRHFSADEIDLAQSVTRQVAGALARARLARVQQQLGAAIEQAGEIVVITDPAGTIVYVNPAFEFITGYSQAEAVGQNPRLLKSGRHDREFYRQLWATIQSGQAWRGHLTNRKKDGSLYTEEAVISPVYGPDGVIVNYVAVKRDVTMKLRREEQLRQGQKMEAVGRLAGGVAHDFNNLLTAISGYTGLLLARYPNPADPTHRDLAQIQKAGERAAGLTRQLLAFSRKQVLQPEVIDLNGTVTDVDNMLRRLLGEDIDIRTHLAPGLGRVLADRGQVEQVILNLAVNARDAMPGGGRLTIETENVSLDEAYAGQRVEVKPGCYVRLAVSDTGAGIGPDVLPYLFEPFFSTKGEHGTGLGLATVHGIVKQSGGHVDVYSEAGHGTTFYVYLPRLEASPDNPQPSPARPEVLGGRETVLVVEDEEQVRELVSRALRGQGYTVLAAAAPETSLALAAVHASPIHLLLTDIIMPGMNGLALAEEMKLLRPQIKVLYMSGYTDNAISHYGILQPGMAFIQKPFTLADIASKVRETLDK